MSMGLVRSTKRYGRGLKLVNEISHRIPLSGKASLAWKSKVLCKISSGPIIIHAPPLPILHFSVFDPSASDKATLSPVDKSLFWKLKFFKKLKNSEAAHKNIRFGIPINNKFSTDEKPAQKSARLFYWPFLRVWKARKAGQAWLVLVTVSTGSTVWTFSPRINFRTF